MAVVSAGMGLCSEGAMMDMFFYLYLCDYFVGWVAPLFFVSKRRNDWEMSCKVYGGEYGYNCELGLGRLHSQECAERPCWTFCSLSPLPGAACRGHSVL